MKLSLLMLCLGFIHLTTFAQRENFDVFGVETNPLGSPNSLVTLDTLESAQTLGDLYARYPSNWVKDYRGVEITSTCRGVKTSAKGKDDHLTQAQLKLLAAADADCQVEVTVDYIPKNKLKYNPARQMDFSLRMRPFHEAKFPGGIAGLRSYLKSEIVDEIPAADFEQIALATVRFRVDQYGMVTQAKIETTSGNDQIDQFILDRVGEMPSWTPAYSSTGQALPQDFEILIGTSLLSCSFRH